MITISMTSNLVSHVVNNRKPQLQRNDHVLVRNNSDPNNIHNDRLDASKQDTAFWTMIPVNVECLQPDTTTIRMKDSVTCLHTVNAEEPKTIQSKNANNFTYLSYIYGTKVN